MGRWGNQGTPLSKTVPFFQNTSTSLKIPLPLTVGNIIKTICFVTNTHPSYNDHTTLFHIITIPHGMVTRNSHYVNVALYTRSHCGPIFNYEAECILAREQELIKIKTRKFIFQQHAKFQNEKRNSESKQQIIIKCTQKPIRVETCNARSQLPIQCELIG